MRNKRFILFALCTFFCFSTQWLLAQKPDSISYLIKNAKEDSAKVKLLDELIFAFNQKGEYNNALEQAEKALRLSEKIGYQKGIAGSLSSIGNAYSKLGNFPLALSYYLRALKMDEVQHNEVGIAKRLGNIGLVYYNQGDNARALDFYMRALQKNETLGRKKSIAIQCTNIGALYYSQLNYPKALEFYLRALQTDEELSDDNGIAADLCNIGGVYSDQKNYSAAMNYFQKAADLSQKIGDQNTYSSVLGNLGVLCTSLKKYKEAGRYLDDALKLSRQIGSLLLLKDHYQYLSELYEQWGKPKEALKFYQQYIIARDSVFNEENTKQMVRSEMNFEFEKKENAARLEQEKKQAVAEAESKKQRMILWLVSCVLVLVGVFAFFAYRSYLQKQKSNIEITRQKQVIEEKQKEILDSIHYAKRIQMALLPSDKYLERHLG